MKYKVKLTFFNDDATGEWGLAHFNSINRDENFNAFWSGRGMFHDVFEHYFEGVNKYFKNEYSFNVGGEVAAMGHRIYYYDHFRPSALENRYQDPITSMMNVTLSDMKEAILCGYYNFGYTLESGVPSQKSSTSYALDSIINEHMYIIEQLEVGSYCHKDQEREAAQAYRESVTEQKLHDLYIWGYKEAEKIAPCNRENGETIDNFISYWSDFCAQHTPDEMRLMYSGLEVTINGGDKLSWNAYFITHEGKKVHHLKHIMYEYV